MPERTVPGSVKQARKALAGKIRNDFEFLPERHPADKTNGALKTTNVHVASAQDESLPPVTLGNVPEWRERTFAESDPSTEEEETEPHRRRTTTDAEDDGESMMRQQQQDTDQETEARITRRRQARKRRRRKRLEEEMEWNEGLRFWEARRDAWCAARKVPAQYSPHMNGMKQTITTSSDSQALPLHHRESPPSSPPMSPTLPSSPSDPHTTTLLPVAPPLLPATDPTRTSITPTMYPSIYDKVVKQSLVPSIPINLSHMIPALVQGWQSDGEWPPKPGVPEPSMAKQRDMLKLIAGNEAIKARGRAYGAPAKEGDVLAKKRGAMGGLFGAVSGLVPGMGSSARNGEAANVRKESQLPSTPEKGEEGYKKRFARHLRNRSSASAASTSETQTVGTPGKGNVSDNEAPGGHGLVDEEAAGEAIVESPTKMKKGVLKMGKMFKGLGNSAPAGDAG